MAEALETYEGRDVVRTSLRLRGTGDGLSKAMKVDPQILHLDDTVYLVIEAKVMAVSYDPLKDNEDLVNRIHVLKASQATIVPADLVATQVADHRDRLARVMEEEKGVQRLPTDNELTRAHEVGMHNLGLMPGCPICDLERDVTESEVDAETGEVKRKRGRPKKVVEQTVDIDLGPPPADDDWAYGTEEQEEG